MLDSQEFRKYAVHHRGMSGNTIDQYMSHINHNFGNAPLAQPGFGDIVNPVTDTTQYIIEERPMRFAQIDVFSRLIMDRIIFFGTPVDDQIANIVVAQMLFLESADPRKDIMMYVNSPGGSVYAGLGIYDTMNYIKPDVATICTSLAASMGAILLAGGAKGKRSALPHARVMIHQPSGGAQGKSTDIEITAREIVKLRGELYQILANHTGQTEAQIEADSDRDKWFKADEAKVYGLIDEVLVR
jgi:ATP-dependent Clp protease protease subunit